MKSGTMATGMRNAAGIPTGIGASAASGENRRHAWPVSTRPGE
jgi:hypothetical protein